MLEIFFAGNSQSRDINVNVSDTTDSVILYIVLYVCKCAKIDSASRFSHVFLLRIICKARTVGKGDPGGGARGERGERCTFHAYSKVNKTHQSETFWSYP